MKTDYLAAATLIGDIKIFNTLCLGKSVNTVHFINPRRHKTHQGNFSYHNPIN